MQCFDNVSSPDSAAVDSNNVHDLKLPNCIYRDKVDQRRNLEFAVGTKEGLGQIPSSIQGQRQWGFWGKAPNAGDMLITITIMFYNHRHPQIPYCSDSDYSYDQ